jgi:hypothetical protein
MMGPSYTAYTQSCRVAHSRRCRERSLRMGLHMRLSISQLNGKNVAQLTPAQSLIKRRHPTLQTRQKQPHRHGASPLAPLHG